MNQSICYDRGIVFIHNPGTAGHRFRKWLGFDEQVELGFPTFTTHHVFWNKYKVIVSVRDPIDRALSCFKFLTSEHYDGELTKKYPRMQSWNPQKFFEVILSKEIYICACQYKYTHHLQSNKPPDYLVRFENMDIGKLARDLDVYEPFPVESRQEINKAVEINESLYLGLIEFYKVDYLLFGYRPLPFEEFLAHQNAATAA